jgi:CRP-like cAMP-binding protein
MPDPVPITKAAFTNAFDESFYECAGTPELIATFKKNALQLVCSEDQVLFRQGQPGECVYVVLAGEVGLLLPLSSNDGMGFRAGTGSFVGLPAAFSNEPYSMTAIAWQGTELAMMSRDKFVDMIATNAALSLDVLKILAAETRAARLAIVDAEIGRRPSSPTRL